MEKGCTDHTERETEWCETNKLDGASANAMATSRYRRRYATVCCLCCCGGLPVLALFKAAIMAPASIAIMSAGCTAAALLMLPRDVLLTYRAAYATAIIGPNVKVLVMLLLPIALALWPCVVFVGSTIVALVWPTLVATTATFDDEENLLLGGWLTRNSSRGSEDSPTLFPTIKDALRFTRDFWDFNQHSLFAYLEDVRQARRDGGPFDISFCALLLGACQASVCALLLLVVGSCLAALKLAPIVLGLYVRGVVGIARHLAKNACGFSGLDVFFRTWVVGLTGTCIVAMLIPLVATLTLALGVLACGFAGIHCAVVAYRHGSLCAGSLQMANHCHRADKESTQVITLLWCNSDRPDDHACCFPRCFPHFNLEQRARSNGQRGIHMSRTDAPAADPPAAPASPSAPAMPLLIAAVGDVVPMSAVFDSFFEQCKLVMADGLSRSILTRAALLDLEPAIFLGVPACVLLHTAYRSAATPEGTLAMADGTIVTDATRPRNSITQLLYEPLLALTRSLRHASLSQAQFTQLGDAALAQDASFASFTSDPPVHALLAESLRLAIHVSRLPMFRRRFGGALGAVLRMEVESRVDVTVEGG